ncbi:MAG: hypothetical protein JO210_00110 [Acidobacteriaceae bacterium]|nr:hypothetical protein [Acidobacteriaceae bacterium]
MVIRTALNFLFLYIVAVAACYAEQAGIENSWDVRTILTNLGKDTDQLKPLLANLKPQQWCDQKGASSTYILQWQTAQRQLNDISVTSKLLAQKTESLPLALDDYFRLEALDVTTRSLEEGTRKYGDRATADQLGRLIARNFTNRERLRDYLRDLAASTEQNFKIADEEAQRCRGMISKEPTSASKKLRK